MRRCVRWYAESDPGKVVDLGAMNVNGSYRELFAADTDYVGVDLEPGPGVQVVLGDVYRLPFEDDSVDLVITGQMLEHCAHFWRVFTEIARILKPEGLAFIIAPSSGPVHRYPVDCYRFYPDSYQALADWSGLRLIHSWTDERGPWHDIVGVFQKGGNLRPVKEPPAESVAANMSQDLHSDPAVEARSGARHYLQVLGDLHAMIGPKRYLEIGVRKGASLALAGCPAIAVDPDPHPDLKTDGSAIRFYRCTSDDFFFFYGGDVFDQPVDLAFIDGMHLAEFVYRDFMNVERVMDRSGVIVVDDIFPNHPLQGERERQSKVWSGDVWRFADRLAQKRPDLHLTWLDAAPTGLLLISNLNPRDRSMWEEYNSSMRQIADEAGAEIPERILKRHDAIDPDSENLRAAIGR